MDTKKLNEYLSALTPLSSEFKNYLHKTAIKQDFPKGTTLLKSGEKFSQTFFVLAGLIKSRYFDEDGKQVVTRFWKENEIVLPKGGFMENMESLEDIVLLEDCKLLSIHNKQIEFAYHAFSETYKLSRKIHFKDSRKQYQRATLLVLPAVKAYPAFCQLFPCNRILLQDIAYFLNIRPYTLSRIRAKRK